MCAINGIFAYHYAANAIDVGEMLRTRESMAARGPDGKGSWVSHDRRVGLAQRRLAIIDVGTGGAQPMPSADGRLVITFNGEIYNYRELRQSLVQKGCVFRSNSDTEVLLHLYAHKGEAMVSELRGMFAFAIWDAGRASLLLVRDRFGMKPLYYADDGWTFRFASQVKALVAGGGVSREVEPAGIVGFHLFGSVPEPFTTLAEVRSLPAGTVMLIERRGPGGPRRYYSVARAYLEGHGEGDLAGDRRALAAAIRESVSAHLVADVPIGCFLSGGIDSGSLFGLMAEHTRRPVPAITIGFDELKGTAADEVPPASEVARHFGAEHVVRTVTPSEMEADLPRIIDAMDQPTIDGLNAWFAAKAARERGLSVMISGLGGDESLGGYPSFSDLPRWVGMAGAARAVPGLGRLTRWLLTPFARACGLHPKASGFLELGGTYAGAYLLKRGLFMPWELDRWLDRDVVRVGLQRLAPLGLIQDAITPMPNNAFARVAAMEASLYMRNQLLRDTDWAGMAHGVEVRMPLVDHVLLAATARVSGSLAKAEGKTLLAAAPLRPLPPAIAARAKTGFEVPMRAWMQRYARTSQTHVAMGGGAGAWSRAWALHIASRFDGVAAVQSSPCA